MPLSTTIRTAQWLAGIEIGEPGYKRILIQPQPGGGLTHARAAYHSIYGEIESAWELSENEFTLKVVIPANTTAMVFLPAQNPSGITESNAPLEGCPGIIGVTQQGGAIQVEIGSGTYQFKGAF
jgi:alpha-L-rhamnosidase